MIIEVRPTPASRRYRTRVVRAVAGLVLVGATLMSVSELADAAHPLPGGTNLSDPVRR